MSLAEEILNQLLEQSRSPNPEYRSVISRYQRQKGSLYLAISKANQILLSQLESLNQEYASKLQSISRAEDELNNLRAEIGEAESKLAEMASKIQDAQKQLDELESKKQQYRNEINQLQDKILDLQNTYSHLDEAIHISQQLISMGFNKHALRNLAELVSRFGDPLELISKMARINQIESKIRDLQSKKDELESQISRLESKVDIESKLESAMISSQRKALSKMEANWSDLASKISSKILDLESMLDRVGKRSVSEINQCLSQLNQSLSHASAKIREMVELSSASLDQIKSKAIQIGMEMGRMEQKIRDLSWMDIVLKLVTNPRDLTPSQVADAIIPVLGGLRCYLKSGRIQDDEMDDYALRIIESMLKLR